MSSFIAAGTSYAHRGVPMVPFFIFYSMFGFQRVGDLIWQAADARDRGFLLGATAGRTTLLGEGLQHQDGHSLLLASTVPRARPTTRRSRTRWRRSSSTASSACTARSPRTSSTTSPSTTRTTRCRRCPTRRRGRASWPACTSGPTRPRAPRRGPRSCSPARRTARRAAAADELAERVGRRRRAVVGDLVQGAARGGAQHRALEPPAPVGARRAAARRPAARRRRRSDRRGHRLHEGGARADRAVRRPSVRPARHRRLRPLRHPRGAPPLLRGRRTARRRRGAVRARCDGRRQAREWSGRHRALRHRPRRGRSLPRV